MNALHDSHTLTNDKVLPQLRCFHLDFDGDILNGLQSGYLVLINRNDGSFAAQKVSSNDLTPVSNLDLQLSVIAHCLHHGLVSHEIPFILVRGIATTVLQQAGIKLESSHLIEHWAHILMSQLTERESHEQVPIPEHQVLPQVDILA
jgi:hypothetical protein